jgi:hypothetical protein
MRQMAGDSYLRSLRQTLLPEFLSMNLLMAGMVVTRRFLMPHVDGSGDPLAAGLGSSCRWLSLPASSSPIRSTGGSSRTASSTARLLCGLPASPRAARGCPRMKAVAPPGNVQPRRARGGDWRLDRRESRHDDSLDRMPDHQHRARKLDQSLRGFGDGTCCSNAVAKQHAVDGGSRRSRCWELGVARAAMRRQATSSA